MMQQIPATLGEEWASAQTSDRRPTKGDRVEVRIHGFSEPECLYAGTVTGDPAAFEITLDDPPDERYRQIDVKYINWWRLAPR
jgi:hypothetical protein